jgi:hypothetical protein
MSDEKFERVFRTVDANRRATLKKLVTGAAFSVPIIASFSVPDLANAQVDSGATTTATEVTVTVTRSVFVTKTVTTITGPCV